LKNKIALAKDLRIVSNKEEALLLYEQNIVDMLYKQVLNIEKMEVKKEVLKLEGSFRSLFSIFGVKLILNINGMKKELLLYPEEKYQVTSLNQRIFEGYRFVEEIPLNQAETRIKVKAKVEAADTQIKITFRENETDNSDTVLENVVAENYKILYQNKTIVIQNIENTGKESVDKKTQQSAKWNHFSLNKTVSKCYAIAKQLRLKMQKQDSDGYFYATTYNQVCRYKDKELALGKLTDSYVCIEQCQLNNNVLGMSGTIKNSFVSGTYLLKCSCNLKKVECEHNKKQNTFHVKIPLSTSNQIEFSLIMINAEAIVPIKLEHKRIDEALRDTRYHARISIQLKLYKKYK
jgi:hypothetical protein